MNQKEKEKFERALKEDEFEKNQENPNSQEENSKEYFDKELKKAFEEFQVKTKKRKSRLKFVFILIAIIILAINVIFIALKSNTKVEPTTITYSELIQLINSDEIESIVIANNSVEAKAISKNNEKQYVVDIPSQEVLLEFIQEKIINGQEIILKYDYTENSSSAWWSSFINLVIILWPILMLFLLIRSAKKITKNLGSFKSKDIEFPSFMNIFNTDINFSTKFVKSDKKLSDVAGLNEEKQEIQEIVDFLKRPEKYAEIGAKIPKGILLSGAPGTGKTLLAKAIAGEADVPYIAISGSEFIGKYVGVGASRIRDLFKEAQKNTPSIIFIDELDAIGERRDNGENSERNQTIDQLLTELDGFGDRTNIIVLAATNRPDSLDPALTRPGRFDRKIHIPKPDLKGREEILKIHSRGKKFSSDINFKDIAYNTAGYTGAELENLLNESAIIAARCEHSVISNKDIEEALAKITIGLKRTGKVISKEDRKLTAYHEAGHAVVALFTKSKSNLKEISIIPRGSAGGYTWHKSVDDNDYLRKSELEDELVVLLGGRVAEKLIFGDISSGAANDLKRASRIVHEMIVTYGMDKEFGPLTFTDFNNSEIGMFGEELLNSIGKRSRCLIKSAEISAEIIIMDNKDLLESVAQKLLEQETISGEEIDILFREYTNQ